MNTISKKIHNFVGKIRSIFFNIKVLPLKRAIKLPIIISPFVKIISLNGKIIIEDNVWIGCRNIILKGTTIKKGSVVGTNLLIIGEFKEENILIAGNPAKIKRKNIYWEN